MSLSQYTKHTAALKRLTAVSIIALCALPAHSKSGLNSVDSISKVITCLESFNSAASESFESNKTSTAWSTPCKAILADIDELHVGYKSPLALAKQALLDNLSLKADSSRLSSAVDQLNEQIALRNPQIALDLQSQINSQYFSQCASNSEIQVGMACYTTSALKPINDPFSYYQIGSIDTPVLSLSYDIVDRQQDMLIQAAKQTVNQNQSTDLEFRKNLAQKTLNASDELSVAMQTLLVREAIERLYLYSFRTVESQLEAGFSTVVEVERVKSRYESAKQDKDTAIASLNKSLQALNNLLSKISSSKEQHGLFLINPFSSVYTRDYSKLLQDTLNKSPDINSLRYKAESLGYSSNAAWKALWPKIQASIVYSPEIAAAISGRSSIWESGISQIGATLDLTWSIFDSGLAKSQASYYEKQRQAAILSLEQLSLEKVNQLDKTYKNIEVGKVQLKHSRNAVVQLSYALLGTEQRLKAGFEDVTSLIQTVDTFTQAQLQYLSALRNQNQRFRQLAFTTNNYGSDTIGDEISGIHW